MALSENNIAMVNRWIKQCFKDHDSCQRKAYHTLPTRVLDVSFQEISDDILLYEPKAAVVADYAALSHCWGVPSAENPHFKTELHTLEARMKGITLSEMPKNFVDAVLVARRLGVQYLWIDSLCIIQDSAEDWEREAAKMHRVYQNALITLVATASSATHEGFLQRPLPCAPARIPYTDPNTETPSSYFYMVPDPMHYLDNYFDRYVEGTTWNTRGWTFQECLLSRRLLHFSTSMMIFECRGGTWSEDNAPASSNINRTPWLENFGLLNYSPTELGFAEGDITKDEQMLYQWYLLIERYSLRSLSYGMDKLPALSGLAHELYSSTPDEYLAGIWRRDLHWGLLWATVAYEEVRACESYRAPSWSWAHLDGQIMCDRSATDMAQSKKTQRIRLSMDVPEARVRPEGTDEMGRVGSGWIKALARVRRVSSVFLTRDVTSTSPHDIIADGTKVGEGHLDLAHTSTSSQNLYVLLVLFTGKEPRGLLIEESESQKGEYRRVGDFIFRTPGKGVFGARTDYFDDCVPQLITLV